MSNSISIVGPGGGSKGGAPPIPSIIDVFKPGADLIRYLVLVSIFSWGRDREAKKYGWWGAVIARQDGTAWGSLLWRIWRAKMLKATQTEIQSCFESALAWMVSQGFVDSVDVSVQQAGRNRYDATVLVTQGEAKIEVKLDSLWEIVAYAG